MQASVELAGRCHSNHLDLGVQGTCRLDGLQDGEQILGRCTQCAQGLHHIGQLGACRQLNKGTGLLANGDVSLLSGDRLAWEKGAGWLTTGVELMVTDKLP